MAHDDDDIDFDFELTDQWFDRLLQIFRDLDHHCRHVNTTLEELRAEMKSLRDRRDRRRRRH